VLINGYGGTVFDWDPDFIGALAQSFSLTLPENRGMGGSDLGSEPMTVGALAADALAVMDSRGLGAATIAGWSMGGMVAQALAATAPERVSGLALIATDPGGERTTPPDPQMWARLTDRSGTPREQASRLISVLFPPAVAPRMDEQFGDVIAEARAALSGDALDAQEQVLDAQESAMRAWHDGPYRPRIAELDVPVLVACGTEDQVIPPENSLALAAESERAWLARFPGVGHAVMAQEPQRLATLIRLNAGEAAG
jgi:pimeloyl-ACP methyl ester carboxylesterase